MKNNELFELTEKYGYPLYIYDEQIITRQINKLKNNLTLFDTLYSMKCNPNEDILKCMLKNNVGVDAASSGEVLICSKLGFDKNNIFYSSPGKRLLDIERSFDKSTIVADSIHELALINEFASAKNISLDVGVRINPVNDKHKDIALEVMSGGPSKFGIDYDVLIKNFDYIKTLKNITVSGVHVYFGSQILDVDVLYNNFKIISATVVDLLNFFDIKFVDFGGGFGVKFEKIDVELDIAKLSQLISQDENLKYLKDKNIRCMVESGRYLVSESGVYVTKIVDKKQSMHEIFLIVYGGMNGFFRPIFLKQNHDLGIIQKNPSDVFETVNVAGNLCTPIDMFVTSANLKKAEIGDLVILRNAGAYGYSMSLIDFINHDKPREIFNFGE